MSARFSIFALALLTAVPTFGQTADNYCFLVADNNGIHFDADMVTTVDKSSGEEAELGQAGTINIEAVAFHPFEPALFAADGGLLGTLDPSNGRFTPIGWLGTAYGDEGPLDAGDVDGLTFDPVTAELFGSVRRLGADFLVQVDPTSGQVVRDAFGADRDYVAVTFQGGDVNVDDIAISPTDGQFYALVTDAREMSTLVTVDRTSGVATAIAALAVRDLEGMSFDRSGRLFATPGGDAPDMVEVDPTNGSINLFAAIGINSNRDYEAVTCMAHGAMSSDVDSPELPSEVALLPAYPNPFNPTTNFSFAVPAATDVRLAVFDMLGREVQVLARGFKPAGLHEVTFSARDLPSGLYMYRLTGRDFVLTRTVTLLR